MTILIHPGPGLSHVSSGLLAFRRSLAPEEILERIINEADVPDLLEVLTQRLSLADLQLRKLLPLDCQNWVASINSLGVCLPD